MKEVKKLETVSRKGIEKSARAYLQEVRKLSRNGQKVPARVYERALKDTIRLKEKTIRMKGGRIVD